MPFSIRKRSVRVLLVDPQPEDARRVSELLRAVGHVPRWVDTCAEARSEAAREACDVVMAAQVLDAGQTGLRLLHSLGGHACALPFILLTAAVDDALDVRASDAGAADCLAKDELTPALLERSLRYAVAGHDAREAMRMRAQEFRTLAENASDVIQRFDRELRHLYANPALERYTGVPRASIIGHTGRVLHAPPAVEQQWRVALQNVFRTGIGEEFEFIAPAPGGQGDVWMHARLVPEAGLDGRVDTVLAISRDVTDNRMGREQLRISEEYHRALVQNASDGVSVVGADGIVRYSSMSGIASGGLVKPQWIPGRHAHDSVHPDDLPAMRAVLAELLDDPGGVRRAQMRILLPGGEERTLETVSRNLLHHPAVAGIVVNFHDVTERIRAAETLRASEARYRALMEAVPDLLFVLDGDGTYLDLSAGKPELLAVVPEGLVGRTIGEVLPPATADRLMDAVRETLRSGAVQAVEYRLSLASGCMDFEARLSPDGHGAVLALVRDVTAANRMREALQSSEEQFRTVVESLGEGLVLTGPHSEIVYVNRKMAELCGYAPDQMEGRVSYELLMPPEARDPARQRLVEQLKGTADAYEAHLVRRDGSRLWTQITSAPYRDGTGQVIGTIQVVKDVTEPRRAAERLRSSEERLGLIISQLPALVWTMDRELRVTSSAGRVLSEMEPCAPQTEGQTLIDSVGTDDPGSAPGVQHLRALQGEVSRYEMAWGGRILDSTVQPFRDASGAVAGVLGVALDVTDQRRAEQALRKSERLLRTTVDSAPMALWTLDLDGTVTSSEGAGLRDLGLIPGQMVGRSVFDLYAGQPEVLADVRRALAGEAMHTTRDVGGTCFEIRYTPVRGDDGRVSAVIGVALDVTDRDRARDALHESERRFRSLIENASDVIAVVAEDGTVGFASPSVERLLGVPASSLTGHSMVDLVHPDERAYALERLRRTVHNEGSPEQSEFRVRHRDGGWRVVEVVGTSLLNDDAVGGVVLNIRDVTDRHDALRALEESQAMLMQSQKMEAVGRLAGGVAHDFNNLLTAIRGYAELLMADMEPGSPQLEDVREIRRAADRAADLTRQLLAFSRKQVLQPRVVDLNETVTGMEKMLRRLIGEDVELRTELQAGLGCVRADPGQLEQVLMNLAVNARDAMAGGGQVLVRTANAVLGPDDVRRFHYVVPGEYVLLSVGDTGCGMDEKTVAQVFEPFFTTKPVGEGTGLGLSTVYGVVKQSGGYLWMDSRPGGGTTARIYLPRVGQRADADAPDLRGTHAPGVVHETLLLVEDEAAVRKISLRSLRRAGYHVLEAADGEEALRACHGHDGPVDLLMTDVVMPRMGGRDLAARVRGERPEIRVLFVSGYSEVAVAGNGVLEPGTWFFGKPFTPDALLAKVREVLDAPVPQADAIPA